MRIHGSSAILFGLFLRLLFSLFQTRALAIHSHSTHRRLHRPRPGLAGTHGRLSNTKLDSGGNQDHVTQVNNLLTADDVLVHPSGSFDHEGNTAGTSTKVGVVEERPFELELGSRAEYHKRDANNELNCLAKNGTTFTLDNGLVYEIVCGTDFVNYDIFPFAQAQSLANCVSICGNHNQADDDSTCVGVIFVPSRIDDNCYLKYSIENPSKAAEYMEGAILKDASPFEEPGNPVPTGEAPEDRSNHGLSSDSSEDSTGISIPSVSSAKLHGPTENRPTSQFIRHKSSPLPNLPKSKLKAGIDSSLSTEYPISDDTGVLLLDGSTRSDLAAMSDRPRLSRDCGKGGLVGKDQLFVFCDTGSYSSNADSDGNFLSFVSSSVAIDVGGNALHGKAIALQDGIGEWSDSEGRMRGFAPLTQGERSYNLVMQADGHRYAIWPEASPIRLGEDTAVLYAHIVYDEVNMQTKDAVFTYTGVTLLTITAGGDGGPTAQRTVNRLFNEDEVEWGCIGGIRSWGASGIGGKDGRIYLFGKVNSGLLLARVDASNAADRDSYEYWNGDAWTGNMPSSDSDAAFISGQFEDVELLYSPRHRTFLFVYMSVYADNTFYYRYLDADRAIRPAHANSDSDGTDFVENVLSYSWSEPQVLYKAAPGLNGNFVYAGGVHQGYFGDEDIVNGGTRMLISWTAPTGKDPSEKITEYQIVTGEVTWN